MDGLFTNLKSAGHVFRAEAVLVHPLAEDVALVVSVVRVVVPHGQDFTESVKFLKQNYCQITVSVSIFRRQ